MTDVLNKLIRASMPILLAIAMIFSVVPMPEGYAAWDGYNETSKQKIDLLDFGSISEIEKANGIADISYATKGYSIYWANHTTSQPVIDIQSFSSGVPFDWTGYQVEMKIYSSKATDAPMKIVFHSVRNEQNQVQYFHGDFNADWVGWKTLKFEVSKLSKGRNPDITKMAQRIQIVGHKEYGIEGKPDTELWISELKLIPSDIAFDTAFYGEEKIEQTYDVLENSVAVFANGTNAVTGEGRIPIEYSIDYTNETVMIPVTLFKDFLGAEVCNKEGAYCVRLNGKAVWGKVSSNEISIDSGADLSTTQTLGTTPYDKDGICYVPGAEIASLVGLSTVTDGRFLALGTPEMKAAITRPESLGVNEFNEIAAHQSYSKEIDLESFTEADTAVAKANWKENLVGTEQTNDISDEDIAYKISTINKDAVFALNAYVENPTYCIYGDKVITSTALLATQYDRIKSLAMAYACYGSEYYKDDEVLRKIIHSLDYTTTNYYSTEGRARWEATGQITGINDWSHWDLHIPARLIDTLICIEDKLTKNQIDTYLKYFYTRFAAPFDNGMNYIYTGKSILGSAFLRNDYERAISVLNDMVRTYLFVDDNERIVSNKIVEREGQTVNKKGSGFFSDGSYVFHTFHSMNGTYGLGHFEAAAELESVLKNTRFEINSAAKFNMISFFLDGLDPLFLGTAMYRHVLGRNTNPSHYTTGISALADAFSIAPVYGKEVEDEFYKIIKTAYVTSPYKSDFISKLNINEVKRFKEMILDDSIPVIQDHSINKVYYNMDKVVHERNDWGFGISMMSSRMFGYECINNENMTGWYLGDGRTEWLLRDSDINSTSTYWSSMDPYRLPGTTVDTQERKAVSIYNGNEFLSSKDFVGGVTIDGKYGAAAMDAESYHYDEDFGVDGGQHGGKAPAHKNDLVAKKSYFMLDDAVVCLGTAINAKDNNNSEVLTIVDNVMATQTQTLSGLMSISAPYKIESAVASENPEPENSDINTIDSNYATKWAGKYGEIVWDIGSPQTLGFINLSFQNGDKRKQNFELLISEDNVKWESVFSGMSSGTTDDDEAFDLGSKTGRYVKFINKGNSTGSGWVSLTECSIYPPNMDGTIGLMDIDIAGIDPVYSNNGELSIGIEDSSLQGISWINFDNKCGYWFPSRPANENIGALKARWTNDIVSHFELWFSHGINPTDAGYAYAILPGASKEETKAFAESGNVQILSNNNSVQAVRDLNTNLTYIVFWKSGSFEGIRVSAPCMVIAKETDTTFELALSDPSQKLSQLTLTLNKALKVTKADDFATVTSNDSATEIKYDLTVSPGRTLECEFTK